MKLKQTFETETYISEGGYYAIKQDDEAIVLLSPEQLRLLIADMSEAISGDADWWTSEEKE